MRGAGRKLRPQTAPDRVGVAPQDHRIQWSAYHLIDIALHFRLCFGGLIAFPVTITYHRDEIDLLDLLAEPPGTPPIKPMQAVALAS